VARESNSRSLAEFTRIGLRDDAGAGWMRRNAPLADARGSAGVARESNSRSLAEFTRIGLRDDAGAGWMRRNAPLADARGSVGTARESNSRSLVALRDDAAISNRERTPGKYQSRSDRRETRGLSPVSPRAVVPICPKSRDKSRLSRPGVRATPVRAGRHFRRIRSGRADPGACILNRRNRCREARNGSCGSLDTARRSACATSNSEVASR
jgi:hypothetical protein